MLGNLRIRTRLQACFGLVIVLSLLTTGLGLWRTAFGRDRYRQYDARAAEQERLIAEFASNTAVGGAAYRGDHQKQRSGPSKRISATNKRSPASVPPRSWIS